MRRRKVTIWGLTGGIASGKSTVAELLRDHGVKVFNLDSLGKEITARSSVVQEAIGRIAGPRVIGPNGLDRGKLREVVFSRPEVRRSIEVLLHPLIIGEFEKRVDEEDKAHTKHLVCEAALLVESGYYKKLDGLAVVVATEALRRERLKSRDGITDSLATSILAAQLPDEAKEKVATVVIHNGASPDDLKIQVDAWVQRMRN